MKKKTRVYPHTTLQQPPSTPRRSMSGFKRFTIIAGVAIGAAVIHFLTT